MDPLPASGIALAAGYLLGSVPFSWIAVKVRTGKDLRKEGSGNAGATNAARVLGKAWFVPLFLLDAGKGAGAVGLAGLFASCILGVALDPATGIERYATAFEWVRVAAASGAILGHLFSPWLGFRGGKAVATGAGTLAVLSPWAAVAGLAGFGVTAAISRFVSLGSVVAALCVLAWTLHVHGDRPGPVLWFVDLLFFVVIVKHLPNLRRIAAGTEPRIGERT